MVISLHRDLEYDTTRHVTVDDGIDERLVRHARGLRHFLDAVQEKRHLFYSEPNGLVFHSDR